MKIITENKRVKFDYEILETYEAGLELKGFEVKAIRAGRINLAGAYAIIRDNQAWLINADVPAYQPKNAPEDYDSKRTRRLLLKKSEIKNLIGSVAEKGLTLMPLKVYTKNHRIKIEIGLGRSRKKADKRELIKKRETEREIRRNL
ncbi:SsrA-binding protein [Candidatus Wolfebacteria bacterium RIFCSPLOWO2_01_FULL_38_11]|uniref:SsrA-binding protein n=2 Tax=Candidatus Wolfeibacteriota TaxID=1752735 RepID=A0A0G0FS39_9BACT|nr:MAG: SsrA-binding protein [Candidatus Wolfebacteria bacterium GW2011_GWC1_37_10]OGM90497.1 MAG: SsrA-binding protein [Candidatus Wolfebacteria bacterium RIFCSPLOWO2_01_FULL_38_11]